MPTVAEWRAPLEAEEPIWPAELEAGVRALKKHSKFKDPYKGGVGADDGRWVVCSLSAGNELQFHCFLCAGLKKFRPMDTSHTNTMVCPRGLPKDQLPRLLRSHSDKAEDHKLAFRVYEECVAREAAGGEPNLGRECYEALRREHLRVAIRWGTHAWIALRHYVRCLSSIDFEAAMVDHRAVGSMVYAGIYDTPHFFVDIGRAGRAAVERFQKADFEQSPIKLNLACIDEGKGFLFERIGFFKQVDGHMIVDSHLTMAHRTYGKDTEAFAPKLDENHDKLGIKKLGVFLADGCSVNGVKMSEGTRNLYCHLKRANKSMLGVWCMNHIEQLGAKAPAEKGSPGLIAMLESFDKFLNSVAMWSLLPIRIRNDILAPPRGSRRRVFN